MVSETYYKTRNRNSIAQWARRPPYSTHGESDGTRGIRIIFGKKNIWPFLPSLCAVKPKAQNDFMIQFGRLWGKKLAIPMNLESIDSATPNCNTNKNMYNMLIKTFATRHFQLFPPILLPFSDFCCVLV